MLQIYGSPRTSAGRCYLVLEEVGAAYSPVPLEMMEKKEHKAPPYLKLNPNGKVPCLVDGEFVIWESLAINYYIAEKYKPEFLGKDPEQKGLVQQWSIWGQLELQVPLIDILIQMVFIPEPKRDANVIAKAREKIPGLLGILDQALEGRQYLVGDSVTLADLNMVSVVNIAPSLQIDLQAYPNLMAWFERIKGRPAFQKLLGMRAR